MCPECVYGVYGQFLCIMVCEWVGKEFPDTEYFRIEFIRVGDAVRTVGHLKGESMPFVG